MSSDRLTLRLPERLRTELEALGASTGRSESELAREAIEEYLLRHSKLPTCHDIAKQSRLIGCVETKINDLSTNPKHMKGFGQ